MTDIILLILRILSGFALMIFMSMMLYVLWRDYQSAINQLKANRRSYGQLVALAFVDGMYAETGEVYPLLPLTSFGRSPTNTIILKDNFASSEHALLALRDGQWWLEDRKSRNGTRLNGERITTPTIITSGDVVTIGNFSYRIELEL